jgi:hypothetical protein
MLDFLQDIWGHLRTRKKYWLLPIVVVVMCLSVLAVFAQGSAIAPFIYTLF